MAHKRKYLVWLCVAFTWTLSNCSTDVPLDHEILHIEGVIWACNVSTSYALVGSQSEFEDQSAVYIPVSDGDLLYMFNDQDIELYYRYRAEDGNHILVSTDTLKPDLVYVNGVLSQIQISGETPFEEVLSALQTPLEKPLATLYVRDTLTDAMLGDLQSYETSLQGTGIMLEFDIGSAQFNELVSTCRPNWLAHESIPSEWDAGQGLFLENLELLWVSGNILAFTQNVQCCKNLESLIIADWEPGHGELLPLSELNQLHTLTLAGCKITDLSKIEFPETLQRLQMVECDTLTDIAGVGNIPELISLGMAGSDDLESLGPINGLTQLARISFPENISQEEFTSLAGQMKSLEVIELINCGKVTDLSVLQNLDNLEILILDQLKDLPLHLESLDQLKLIILSSELFEQIPEQIAMLRNKLPNTQVVPGSGICLGSGWLLLLLPMVYLSRLLFRSRSKHVQAIH
jgi:hypothetical protein